MYLLHGCGILTKRAFRVLPKETYNYRTIQRKIHEMIEEGILIRHKPLSKETNATILSMNNYESNKKQITKGIPEECIEYYSENHKNRIRRAWNEKGARPDRILLESETTLFMYSVGVDAMPDQNEGVAKYYGSREIKKYTGYKDEVQVKDGKKKVQFTKVLGLLVSEGGNYAVYNVRHKSVGQLSGGEYKIKYQLDQIAKQLKGTYAKVQSGIMLVDNMNCMLPCIVDEELNSVQVMKYENFANIYDAVYCVPYDEYGRDMVKLMIEPDWRYKLILSATGEVQDTSYVNYVCDHYDKESGVGTLIFCIPDIIRLKRFTDYAKLINDKSKFRVICFDYQKEFVKQVTQGKAQILTTPFYAYFNKEMERK